MAKKSKKEKETQPLTPMEAYIHKVCGSYLNQWPQGTLLLIAVTFFYVCMSMVMVDMSEGAADSGLVGYLLLGAVIYGIAGPYAFRINKRQEYRPTLVRKYVTNTCDNEDFIKVDSAFAQLMLYKAPTEEELKAVQVHRNNCFINGEFNMAQLQHYAVAMNELKKKYSFGPEFSLVIEKSQQYAAMMNSGNNPEEPQTAEEHMVYAASQSAAAAPVYEGYVQADEELPEETDSTFKLAAKRKLCTMVVMQLKAQFPAMIVDQANLQKNIEAWEREYRKCKNLPANIKVYDPLNGWILPDFVTFLAGYICCNKKKVFKL